MQVLSRLQYTKISEGVRLPELLGELAIIRGDGTYHKIAKQYKKVNLLIFDKWLLFPLKESEA